MNGIKESKIIEIHVGEPVTANAQGVCFNLTEDKKYTVLSFDGDCIEIENDLGAKDWYSLDYFCEFYKLFR